MDGINDITIMASRMDDITAAEEVKRSDGCTTLALIADFLYKDVSAFPFNVSRICLPASE